MYICHAHNLVQPPVEQPLRYGIRISLPPDDPLIPILGAEWEKFHWYATAEERDDELEEMSSRHLYSRRGDLPTLIFEKVER
ncbi:MAG: hypothetical protein ACREVN_08660 [Gammaproteobacteria bacterium]